MGANHRRRKGERRPRVNPPGTKIARMAREGRLGKRWNTGFKATPT